MAVWSWWILSGTGTRCCTRWSRASQTCSIGDMSGKYAGHGRTQTFSASRNCVPVLATKVCCSHSTILGTLPYDPPLIFFTLKWVLNNNVLKWWSSEELRLFIYTHVCFVNKIHKVGGNILLFE
jgi:hypothetical protein